MASNRGDFRPAPRRVAVTGSDNQTDCVGEFASVDQAHEQVPDLGAILVFVEQSVLAVKNDFFERPLTNVVVQGCCRLAQEQRQLSPSDLINRRWPDPASSWVPSFSPGVVL